MVPDGFFQVRYGFGIVLVNNAGNPLGPQFAVVFVSVNVVEKEDARLFFPAFIGGNDVGAVEAQKGAVGIDDPAGRRVCSPIP